MASADEKFLFPVRKKFFCSGEHFSRIGFSFRAAGFPFCEKAKASARRPIASSDKNFLFPLGKKIPAQGNTFRTSGFPFCDKAKALLAGRWHPLTRIFFSHQEKRFPTQGNTFRAAGFPFCEKAKAIARRPMASADKNFLFPSGKKISCSGGDTFPAQDFLFVKRQRQLPASRWHLLIRIFFSPSMKENSCLVKHFCRSFMARRGEARCCEPGIYCADLAGGFQGRNATGRWKGKGDSGLYIEAGPASRFSGRLATTRAGGPASFVYLVTPL